MKYKISTDNGSFTLAFSNNGLYLAVACVQTNSYPIRIYNVLNGERLATLDGHLDLVYQISWSSNDNQLLSSSSDGTSRLWEIKYSGVIQESHILQHPSFVYTGIYFPEASISKPNLLAVSGCFDGNIRLWDTTMRKKSLIAKYSGHLSRINSLCFDKEGTRLYSGDGIGVVKIWSTSSNLQDYPEFKCIASIDTQSVLRIS